MKSSTLNDIGDFLTSKFKKRKEKRVAKAKEFFGNIFTGEEEQVRNDGIELVQ